MGLTPSATAISDSAKQGLKAPPALVSRRDRQKTRPESGVGFPGRSSIVAKS
jgi:hypothetical protein